MSAELFKDRVEYSKSLLVSAMLFNTIVMAANFVGQKPLAIFGLIVSAGSAIFPLTYLISVLVTEIFGRESAKSIIRTGFVCNILIAIFISLTIHFPHPEFWDSQLHYETIMQQMWKIFVLSSLAYILSEYTNLYVFTYITKMWQGKNFQLRVFCSTLCAIIVDTLFLIPLMMKSSPTYSVIIHKVISLIIFKCCFVFSGLLFISFIRDLIINSEISRRQLTTFSDHALESSTYKQNSTSNIFWYRDKSKVGE